MPSPPPRRHPRAKDRRSVEPFEESGVPPCLPPLTPPESEQQDNSDEIGDLPPCNSNAGNDDGVKAAESSHALAAKKVPPKPPTSLADQRKNPAGNEASTSPANNVNASTTSMEARRRTDSSSKAARANGGSIWPTSSSEVAKTNSDPEIATTPSKDVAKSDGSFTSPTAKNIVDYRKGIAGWASKNSVKTGNNVLTMPPKSPAKSSKSTTSSAAKAAEDCRKISAATSKDTAKTDTSNPTTPSKETAELESDTSGNLAAARGATDSKKSPVQVGEAKDSKISFSRVSDDQSKGSKPAKKGNKTKITSGSTERESMRKSREELASSKGATSASSRQSKAVDRSNDSKDGDARRSATTSSGSNVTAKKDLKGPADIALMKRSTRSSSVSTESSASKETKDSDGAPSEIFDGEAKKSTKEISVLKDDAKPKTTTKRSPSRNSVGKTDSNRDKNSGKSSKKTSSTFKDAKDSEKEAVAKDNRIFPVQNAGNSKKETRKSIGKLGGKTGVRRSIRSSKVSISSKKFSRHSKGSEEKLGHAETGKVPAPTEMVKEAQLGPEKSKSSRALSPVASSERGSRSPFSFDKATSDSSSAMKQTPLPASKPSFVPDVLDQNDLQGKSEKSPGNTNSKAVRTKSVVSLNSKQTDKAAPVNKTKETSESPSTIRRSLASAPIEFFPVRKSMEPLRKSSVPFQHDDEKEARPRISGAASSGPIIQPESPFQNIRQTKGSDGKKDKSVEEEEEDEERESVEELIEQVIVKKAPSLLAERIPVALEKDVTPLQLPTDNAASRDSTARQGGNGAEKSTQERKSSDKTTAPISMSTGLLPPPVLKVLTDQSHSRQSSVTAGTGSVTDSIADATKLKSDRMDTAESVRNFFAKQGSASDRLSVSMVQSVVRGRSPSQQTGCAATHAEIAEKAMELFEMLEMVIRQRRQLQQQQAQQRLRTAARNSHSVQWPVQSTGFSSARTFVAPPSAASAMAFSGGMISQAALQQIDFEEVSTEDLDGDNGMANSELSGASAPSSSLRASVTAKNCAHFKKLS